MLLPPIAPPLPAPREPTGAERRFARRHPGVGLVDLINQTFQRDLQRALYGYTARSNEVFLIDGRPHVEYRGQLSPVASV